MSKNYETQADRIQNNGKVPPRDHQMGTITLAAGAVTGNYQIAPCDLYIERIIYRVLTASANANAAIAIGDTASDTAYLNNFNINGVAAGFYELDMANAAVLSRVIPRGTAFRLNAPAAASGGVYAAAIVTRPL